MAASELNNDSATLVARGLAKIYGTGGLEVHALRGVDFDLYQGELIVLLGPSSSGKSTLLNILGALDTPTSGNLVITVGDEGETRIHDIYGGDLRWPQWDWNVQLLAAPV